MKEKSKAVSHLTIQSENQSDQKSKTLKTDRGCISLPVMTFSKWDYAQNNSQVYPQQIEVAERKGITIFNIVRYTLRCKKLPKAFWEEAFAYPIVILNW